MSWQILVVVSVVTYSVSVLLQRVLLKNEKSDPVAFSIVFQLIVGVLTLAYALVRGFSMPSLAPLLPNLLAMVVLYGAGNVFIFKALKLVEASEFTIIFATRVLWTIGAAILFLGEAFAIKQLAGTVLILAGVVLVSWHSEKIKFGTKGSIFSLLAAAAFGLAFANDAFLLRNFDVPSYLSIAFIAPTLGVWLISPGVTTKMRVFLERQFLLKLGLLGTIYAVSAITVFLAYQIGRNAAQIAPLNQLSTVVVVILGIVFLKEKSHVFKKMVGALLGFVGMVLVG